MRHHPHQFDPSILRPLYDRGQLVPFIGSGMSVPACTGWRQFVAGLEAFALQTTGAAPAGGDEADPTRLIERALQALQAIRRHGRNLADAVRSAVYCPEQDCRVPPAAAALARLHWPLVCTTNYDEIYLKAKAELLATRAHGALPRVLGRSENDCRRLLQHLRFPTDEVLWALQGFLRPMTPEVRRHADLPRLAALESELVIGHAEYRKTAHLAPHFRRTFAELFRSRSFLFLGSGLTEPYFRTLFDEIIELTGPPDRPHYAFVQEGSLDPEFMQREYHIVCFPYPAGRHDAVVERLDELATHLGAERVRHSSWGYRIAMPQFLDEVQAGADFSVVRGVVPARRSVGEGEAVAISCGRARLGAPDDADLAVPLPSGAGAAMLGLPEAPAWDWHGRWVVQWQGVPDSYGIVARESYESDEGGDERSPEAVRRSFMAFLDLMQQRGVRHVHVQLLAAGRRRVFAPWVSLVQMARGYGAWAQTQVARPGAALVRATVYVVDPAVLALLQGGHLDINEQLDDRMLRVHIVVLDADGQPTRHHELLQPDKPLRTLPELQRAGVRPAIHCVPSARVSRASVAYEDLLAMSFRELGLVSGGTLVLDFSRAGSDEHAARHREGAA